MVSEDEDEVNKHLQKWQQGDLVLTVELPFIHAFNAHQPVTQESRAEVELEPPIGRSPDFRSTGVKVSGFAVLTQTCDLVRDCRKRPYVEIAPLTDVDDDTHQLVLAGYVPRYAKLPALADEKLVVDLDRVMTVEKSVLVAIPDKSHVKGCHNDVERRLFAQALARKRSRFAFPSDFTAAMRPIQKRVKTKHKKESDEGSFLRTLLEIRVKADPDWSAEEKDLTFYFILPEEVPATDVHRSLAQRLIGLFDKKADAQDPEVVVLSTATMSASLYLATIPLDLDHLSD